MPSLVQHRLRSRLLKRPPQPKHPFAILHLPQPVSRAFTNASGCRFPQDFLNLNENLTGRTALLCETGRVGHFRPRTVASNIEKI